MFGVLFGVYTALYHPDITDAVVSDFVEVLTSPSAFGLIFIDNFSDLGLAVYYMDDGHLDLDRGRACFSLKRFKGTKTLEMVADFFNSIGIECSAYMESGKVQMTVKGSDELFKRIYK